LEKFLHPQRFVEKVVRLFLSSRGTVSSDCVDDEPMGYHFIGVVDCLRGPVATRLRDRGDTISSEVGVRSPMQILRGYHFIGQVIAGFSVRRAALPFCRDVF
jgi:hypothetical protein